jgi:hypothetical protein
VEDKDREIAMLHELLEKSFKQVTVEGIMTASQLEAKTKQLAKLKKMKTKPITSHSLAKHNHKFDNGKSSSEEYNSDRIAYTDNSNPVHVDAIEDLSSIEARSDSNPPLQKLPTQTW